MDEIEEQIFLTTIDEGALVTRGSWFLANTDCHQEYIFFRATFCAAPLDRMDEAMIRFGNALRSVFELKPQTNGVNGH
jgi:aromatic amino acid aminotransferase I